MKEWYSACFRLVCLIEREGSHRYQDSVVLMLATSFKEAFNRTLEIGRSHEQEFLNADGDRVRWRLKEIISLDILGNEDLDSREVYSQPVDVPQEEHCPFDQEFEPEKSEPTHAI